MVSLLATALLAASLGSIPGREVLPARNQALLLLRVLSYDRNLRARSGAELTVVVAYREGSARSEHEREIVAALEEAARSFTVSGLKARVVSVPWRGAPALAVELRARGAAALYVGESLSEEAAAISAATRGVRSTLSFAPLRAMVEEGLALGLLNAGERARLLVNLAAAREEGADLDSVLLGIVEVLGRPAPAAHSGR
jgi:hypothetical protein